MCEKCKEAYDEYMLAWNAALNEWVRVLKAEIKYQKMRDSAKRRYEETVRANHPEVVIAEKSVV